MEQLWTFPYLKTMTSIMQSVKPAVDSYLKEDVHHAYVSGHSWGDSGATISAASCLSQDLFRQLLLCPQQLNVLLPGVKVPSVLKECCSRYKYTFKLTLIAMRV